MRDTTKLAWLALCGVLTACTSRATGGGFGTDNANGGTSTPAANGADAAIQSLGGNPTGGKAGGVQCGAKSTAPGCACENVGAAIACWTGPGGERNKGKCHDGKQTCRMSDGADVGGGVWGSCEGEQLDCGNTGSTDPDAGAKHKDAGPTTPPVLVCANPDVPNPDGGTGACCVNCGGCVPGAVAWCYDSCIGPPEYCVMTIQQTCQPDGTWGACTETGQTFTNGCIHFWDGCDLNGGAGSYAGNCDGVLQGCDGDFNNQCPGSTGTGDFGTGGPLPPLGTDGGTGGLGK